MMRQRHHRAVSLAGQSAHLEAACRGDPTGARAGAVAEAWQLV
jgi:hypothetical protein